MNAVGQLAVLKPLALSSSSEVQSADAKQITAFLDALFRYADEATFISLRAFYDDSDGVFEPAHTHQIDAEDDSLLEDAIAFASRCASAPEAVVFCPPVATFRAGSKADEAALANGLVLSVECDSTPTAARTKLESFLGPATVVVASGGEWIDPDTGEVEPKLHLHWRLNEPTREVADHKRLKTRARSRRDLSAAMRRTSPSSIRSGGRARGTRRPPRGWRKSSSSPTTKST